MRMRGALDVGRSTTLKVATYLHAWDHARMNGTRIVPLEGGCNFRDFGGYATMHGRAVRWGRLYRSGVLSRLTEGDVAVVRKLGPRMVCDLRRADERRNHPTPSLGPDVELLHWEGTSEISPIRNFDFSRSGTRLEAQQSMIGMYQRLPFVLRARLRGVFDSLQRLGNDGAVIVHCSAGKDRTGIAAALVLAALGVPRETIVADYVLTNASVDLRRQLFDKDGTGVGLAATAEPILALSPAARDAVLAAESDYISAGLDAIDTKHGSVEAYLQAELGVGSEAIARLRGALLD
jgi:protein-tyrosine phosphatase